MPWRGEPSVRGMAGHDRQVSPFLPCNSELVFQAAFLMFKNRDQLRSQKWNQECADVWSTEHSSSLSNRCTVVLRKSRGCDPGVDSYFPVLSWGSDDPPNQRHLQALWGMKFRQLWKPSFFFKKRMQIYKYKIRHESEYLLRMRKEIMTDYRSAGELGPFLLRSLQAIYQKCWHRNVSDCNTILSPHLEPFTNSQQFRHSWAPAREGTCSLRFIGFMVYLLLHLTKCFYNYSSHTSSTVIVLMEN